MLSVVMPYWKRKELLYRSLDRMGELYKDLGMEVIVVDDGSRESFEPKDLPFMVTVLTLPKKDHAMNPCVPFNRGVEIAKGEVLAITNPEIYHRDPVFYEMLDELDRLGENGYVLASTWCNNLKLWYCHPSGHQQHTDRIPPGFGLHFCGMMHKSLYERVGGFDEDYRDGAGYDDNDFAFRLFAHEAECKIINGVVEHTRTNTGWNPKGFQTNKKLFDAKWGQLFL